FDAWNGIADGVLHHGRAVFGLDVKTRAIERNVGKLGHQRKSPGNWPSDIMTPTRESTARKRRRAAHFRQSGHEQLPADGGNEVAGLVDQPNQTLDDKAVGGTVLDGACAFGDREGADTAR